VLSVYYFPSGIVGHLRERALRQQFSKRASQAARTH
jgi:hypothetical protein